MGKLQSGNRSERKDLSFPNSAERKTKTTKAQEKPLCTFQGTIGTKPRAAGCAHKGPLGPQGCLESVFAVTGQNRGGRSLGCAGRGANYGRGAAVSAEGGPSPLWGGTGLRLEGTGDLRKCRRNNGTQSTHEAARGDGGGRGQLAAAGSPGGCGAHGPSGLEADARRTRKGRTHPACREEQRFLLCF